MTGFGLVPRAAAGFIRARRRFGWLDHLVRAAKRYDQADGGRLAAAVTYYAFFAAFSLALLGFAILSHVLDNGMALRSVQGYLSHEFASPRRGSAARRPRRRRAGRVCRATDRWPLLGRRAALLDSGHLAGRRSTPATSSCVN